MDVSANLGLPIGTTIMHHSFGGAVPYVRGWMLCNGDVVNQTNYEAIHGSGSYAADGIANSPVAGKHLPDFTDRYPRGVQSTTHAGNVAIPTVGAIDNEVDVAHTHGYQHIHQWHEEVATAVPNGSFNSSGVLSPITNSSPASVTRGIATTTATSDMLGDDFYTSHQDPSYSTGGFGEPTDNETEYALVPGLDISPDSIEVLFLIKVI